MIRTKGEFKEVKKSMKGMGGFDGLLNVYPNFINEVNDLRTKLRNENWEEFRGECIQRYNDFRELGLKPEHSLYLSGIGKLKTYNIITTHILVRVYDKLIFII